MILLFRSLHMNLLGALLIVALRLPVRHRLVAPDRRDRLVVEPDLGHDGGDAAAHLPDLPGPRLDRTDLLRHRALGRRHRLHRRVERRHHLAGPEDRLPGRRHAAAQQIAILVGALASALVLGPILLRAERGRRPSTCRWPTPPADRRPGLRAGPARRPGELGQLAGDAPAGRRPRDDSQRLPRLAQDRRGRRPAGQLPGRTTQGVPVYLVDPGINGIHDARPDGTEVDKFDAPKATLMSYIIKGILNRELPWGLVLLGVMIAVVLEMSGIPSLAFAVGVYLPLSSSTPDLRRRPGALAGRPPPAQAARAPQPDRGGAGRRGRQEPRRADGLRLHRGRRHRRHRHRLHGRRADRLHRPGHRDHGRRPTRSSTGRTRTCCR